MDYSYNGGTLISPELAAVQREIYNSFGDRVDFVRRAKSLIKFGRATTGGSANVPIQVSTLGNETYVSTNIIDTVSSSSGSDAVDVIIEGHTVNGTGFNAEFTFKVQTATVNGQNKVTLATPLARCSRIYNAGATELVGAVYVYQDSAITAGVPDDLTLAHAEIPAGDNQTFKAATTIDNADYFAVTKMDFGVARGGGASVAVDFEVQIRRVGGVFRPVLTSTVTKEAGSTSITALPYFVVPKNADIRVVATSSGTSTPVRAIFSGYLASVNQP